MAAVHQNFVDLALRLITANGRAITVRRRVITRDVTKPWKVATSVDTDSATVGVFVDTTGEDLLIATLQAIGAPEGARTSVGARVTQCLIPAAGLSFEIRAKDVIVDGDDTWEIVDVEKLQPGPTTIMFICTLGH